MAEILITGADGQLGNELREVSKNYYGYNFIFTDVGNLDISDGGKLKAFISENRPDWIINCAAYNFVDRAETESEKAYLINSIAVKNIADAIKDTPCRFIHFSTDYVFDGSLNLPYNENSPVDPRGEYGRSKLAGEKAAITHSETMIIRTSWLYSSYGANFLKTILSKAKENDTLRVVFDQTGTPTYARDLAGGVMQIVAGVIRNQLAFNAGIYHYSNEGVCSWYDFATEIIKTAGIDCKVMPVRSSEYPTAAKRPAYSVLDKSKIKDTYNIEIPHWRTSVADCIKLLK
jgi:dTDP-4-dehydrorhamnose reductase